MRITDYLLARLDGIVVAVLLLILAFIVAAIAKSLLTKVLNKTKLRELEEKAQSSDTGEKSEIRKEGIITYLGKLIYFIVFMLFIPGICQALGVTAISDPITSLLNAVWGYIPNLIAAAVILVAGILIAKLVRELLTPLFGKLNVDKLQDKAGVEVKDDAKLSQTLAYIVYVLIIIPVIIAALQALKISAITEPAVAMLQTVLSYIPNILVALILIVIGTRIAKFTGEIVSRLIASSGVDKRVGTMVSDKAPNFVLSGTVGMIVRVVLDIFFIVEGVNVLKLDILSNIGSSIIGYLPSVLAAVLILVAAFLATAAVSKAMDKEGLKQYATIANTAIFVVAIFMVLNQLGIASTIVNTAFVLILAALAVAFAVAFGIGGKKFASDTLEHLSDKLNKKN